MAPFTSFRESQRTADAKDLPAVEHPRDRAPAMLALCHLIHLQEQNISVLSADDMTHNTVAKMAQICDKYGITVLMRS
jgi:hypothetical protein